MNGAIINSWKSTDKYQEWGKHCKIVHIIIAEKGILDKIDSDFIDLLYHLDSHNSVRTIMLRTNDCYIYFLKFL